MATIAVSAPLRMPRTSRYKLVIEHIRIESAKSYSETRTALEALPRFDDSIRGYLLRGDTERVKAELKNIQGDAGLVIFSIATHGDWLQILSKRRNAVQYVIGNILVSTQMTQHELAAGLYAPLRIVLYENALGTCTFEYDRPSALFSQYGNEDVTVVARDLDQKIYDALIQAAK